MSTCIICELPHEECDCKDNSLIAEDIILEPVSSCSICGTDLTLGYCYYCDAPF